MNRILIVGKGSSGKSTLAKALGEKLGLPVYHLDQHFWKENWEALNLEDKHKVHTKLILEDKWIIEGSTEFLAERAKRANLFIVLDFGRHKTLPSWLHRVWKYRGATRPDMADGNIEKLNLAYLKWQLDGKSNQRKIKTLKKVSPHTEMVILKNRREIKKYLSSLNIKNSAN